MPRPALSVADFFTDCQLFADAILTSLDEVLDSSVARSMLHSPTMSLVDALSQLAIFGATSIMLRNGRFVPLEDAVDLDHGSVVLSATGRCVSVHDQATGRVLARAFTIWSMEMKLLRAAS